MDFPLMGLMDEDACYARLVEALHPDGFACPRCGGDRLGVHRRHRAPVIDYRCRDCRRVFNAFTGTALQKTRRPPSALVLILRGIAQAAPTARLARELGCNRMKLLALRHKLQGHATAGLDAAILPDATVEADECYVNAGEKRHPASRPGGPAATPRQQAARPRHLRQRPAAGGRDDRPRLGPGVPARDRPPVAATIGRDSGRACLHVVANSDRRTLEGLVEATTAPGAMLNTDEWRAYGRVTELGRGHATVNHGAGEWARDDDGDGVREVHCNTMEGTWTGLRNFLRPFRGVSKWYLAGYVAIFEWANNLKRVTDVFLRVLLDIHHPTDPGS